MRRAAHLSRMREMSNAYNILVGEQEGRGHWEDLDRDADNIKMYMKDTV
jgi:hypothetical protein